jgi:hypothetical protein
MAETVKKSRIVSDTDDNLEEALMEEFNLRLKKCMSQVCYFASLIAPLFPKHRQCCVDFYGSSVVSQSINRRVCRAFVY